MKNLKLKVIIGGIIGITITAIVAALLLDCKKYGVYIAVWDAGTIFMWVLVSNLIVNQYINKVNKYPK